MDEQEILREIFRRFRARPKDVQRGVRVGVGDDAAVVRIGRTDVVMTTDTIVEGIDFDLNYFRWSDVGYKAVSAAVSDLYACGASPHAFLVTAGIPRGATPANVRSLMSGLGAAASFHRAPIVGGDITRSPKLLLDVCALGRLEGKFKSRRGARPGDFIYVSGYVGTSRAALMLFQRNRAAPSALRRAHLRPSADRAGGLAMAREPAVTAMMDISDGLLMDLGRLCESSGVAAGIYPGRIPVHPAARRAFRSIGKNPQDEAAVGGEDYVLLFTVRPPVPDSIDARYTCIGRMFKKVTGGTAIYNMERRPPRRIRVKGFLHTF